MSESVLVGVTYAVSYGLIVGYAAYLYMRLRKTGR